MNDTLTFELSVICKGLVCVEYITHVQLVWCFTCNAVRNSHMDGSKCVSSSALFDTSIEEGVRMIEISLSTRAPRMEMGKSETDLRLGIYQ